MKGIQILTEKNKKEVKETRKVTLSPFRYPQRQYSLMNSIPSCGTGIRRSNLHGSYPDRWNMSSMTSVILSQKAKGYSATVMLYMPDI